MNRDRLQPLRVCMFTMQNSWSYSVYMSMQTFFKTGGKCLLEGAWKDDYSMCHRLLVKVQMDTPGSMLYRWFSWGVVSLPEGKSRGMCLVQCARYRLQASKRYIKSLPVVLKHERTCFSQDERSAVQLPLDSTFALRK